MSAELLFHLQQRAQFLCNFHFLKWSLLLMPCPLIGPFIFRDLVYHYWLVDPGQVLCVGLILPCRSFRLLSWSFVEWLSAYLVRWLPCIWITTLQKPICAIKVVQCLLFFSRLACWIVSMTYKHGITPIPAYIPTHLSEEANYLSLGQMLPDWFSGGSAAFLLWGLPEVDLWASSHTTQCQHYYSLESPLPLGALGLNAFNHPWTFQVSYVFPPPTLVPLVLFKFLAEYVKGQLRLLILVAPCWMEAPWIPTVLNMLADIAQWFPITKDLIMDVLVGHVLKGVPYLHLTNFSCLETCVTQTGVPFLSLSGNGGGATQASTSKVYQQCWKEWTV